MEIVGIDLPCPRTVESRNTPEFNEYVAGIRRYFFNLGVLKDER